MPKINIDDISYNLLKNRNYTDFPILLIVDGGGGDYSIDGGSCSLGADYSLIILDNKKEDQRYPIKIENNKNLDLFTSDYDLAFLGDNLILDVKDTTLRLRNDGGILTGNVRIAKASDLEQRAKRGQIYNKNC